MIDRSLRSRNSRRGALPLSVACLGLLSSFCSQAVGAECKTALELRGFLSGIRLDLRESVGRLGRGGQWVRGTPTLSTDVSADTTTESTMEGSPLLDGLRVHRENEANQFEARLGPWLDVEGRLQYIADRLRDPETPYEDRALIYIRLVEGLPPSHRLRFSGKDLVLRPPLNIFQLETTVRDSEDLPSPRGHRGRIFSVDLALGSSPKLFKFPSHLDDHSPRLFVDPFVDEFLGLFPNSTDPARAALQHSFLDSMSQIVQMRFCREESEYAGKTDERFRVLEYLAFLEKLPMMTESQRERYFALVHRIESALFQQID